MGGAGAAGTSARAPMRRSSDAVEPVPTYVEDLWGNGLWLTGSGVAMLAISAVLLRGVGLSTGARDLGVGLALLGLLLLGIGVFEFWSVRVWRARLRERGVDWAPDRSIVPVVRSTVSIPLPREAALEMAYVALANARDRTQGVVRFDGVKRTREGIVAYAGAPLGAFLLFGAATPLPTTVRIAAEERVGATELHVTVWPYFRRWSTPFAPGGEEVADNVAEAIEVQLRIARD